MVEVKGIAADPRLGIVTPLANEDASVDEFIQRVLPQLAPDDRIFCVVDNVSSDCTRERVTTHAKRDPRVVLIWAPENRSVVDAYFRGYREAIATGCDWVLEMDGGLSHLPEEIPRFREAMRAGADYAGGSRFVVGGRYRGPAWRFLLSWGGSRLANLLLATRMRDMTSGFQCFSRAALSRVVAQGVRSRARFFQTEIRARMHAWRWTEVPITYANPSKRVQLAGVWEALVVLWHLRKELRAQGPVSGTRA